MRCPRHGTSNASIQVWYYQHALIVDHICLFFQSVISQYRCSSRVAGRVLLMCWKAFGTVTRWVLISMYTSLPQINTRSNHRLSLMGYSRISWYPKFCAIMCMENSIRFRTNCTSQSFGFHFPGWVKHPRPEADPIQFSRKSGAPFQREANNGGLLMCWCWWSGHHRSARSEDKRIVSLRINPQRPHSARCFIFIMSDPCGLKPGYYYITNRWPVHWRLSL